MKKKSFRDPSGFVTIINDKVYRAINPSSFEEYRTLFESDWYGKLVSEKKIQSGKWVEFEGVDPSFKWLEHQKFHFPLFAHEICAEQLYESATLTIEIAKKAFENGYILKDASAWNVLFDGSDPVFCDVTSFEPYQGGRLWSAYAQFCRHFIIPLILYKYLALSPSRLYLTCRDGVSPVEAKNLLGFNGWKSFASIETILLPSLFDGAKKNGVSLKHDVTNPLDRTVFFKTLSRLERYLINLRPSSAFSKSTWGNYESTRNHYSQDDLSQKYNFLKESFSLTKGLVLDLGCNQGEYSLLAASMDLHVLATDFDEVALIKLQSKLDNSPIGVSLLNITQPTPGIGWLNLEHLSFLDRAKGAFDFVLCLGLIHHLLVTERIPIKMVIDLFHLLSKKYLVVEWIDTEDEKFKEISSLNHYLYENFSEVFFEESLSKKFLVIKKQKLNKAKRTLYLLERISA